MADEPWDEMMGPPPLTLKKKEPQADPPAPPEPTPPTSQPPPVRQSHGSAPPPSSAFAAMPDRWVQAEAASNQPAAGSTTSPSKQDAMRENLNASAKAVVLEKDNSLPVDIKEEDEPYDSAYESDSPDGDTIRQEALKMLEVADESLAGSSYAVHRTITGGFTATTRPPGNNKKRVPTALSGLNYVANRKNIARPRYQDNPIAEADAAASYAREDYEYGDEHVIASMERRTSSSRAPEEKRSSNWSSRYSIDNTMLALSGGAVSSKSFLDETDKDHNNSRERFSARNMFGTSPRETRAPRIFGSGFSFRQKNVFGKQNVTMPQEPNLRTVWMDMDRSSIPPVEPRKSWQEQLMQKKRQRRIYIIVAVALFVFIVTMSSIVGVNKSRASVGGAQTDIPAGAVSFYVTSDAPLDGSEEEKIASDLKAINPETKFLVHLGNIQDSATTLCQPARYGDVANILQDSPVPTFVIPGQEDWANCPNRDWAWQSWTDSFLEFEENFDYDFEVDRQLERLENFAFEESGVLFLGIHVVGGRIPSQEEVDRRNQDNMNWIVGMDKVFRNVRAVVIFGNARPGLPQNKKLFNDLSKFLKDLGLPALYVHANSGIGAVAEYSPFEGADNIVALQAEQGGKNPPLRVSVGFGNRPFIVR